ncbi:MAG TPA: tetratricopeptide repeat protein [Fimbriimonas sp.]
MPTEKRRYLVPVLVVAALAAAVFLGTRGEGGQIGSESEFARELLRLEEDAIPLLAKIDETQGEVSEADRKELESFHPRLERLLRYRQDSIAAAFLAGKVNLVLGNHLTAEKWLQQAVRNAEPRQHNLDVADTRLEAYRLLSVLYLNQNEYDQAFKAADAAVKGRPNNPEHRIARASALVQLNRTEEARKDLQAALQLDPANERARGLIAFLGAETPPKRPERR